MTPHIKVLQTRNTATWEKYNLINTKESSEGMSQPIPNDID